MKQNTLGCYLIVKNEELYIRDCIENLLRVCDEIVIVDTGSTDKTKNIIQEYQEVKIYDFKWVYDFSAARNYALSLTKSDYVFSIDADEYLTDDLIDYLLSLKKDNFKGYNSIKAINDGMIDYKINKKERHIKNDKLNSYVK